MTVSVSVETDNPMRGIGWMVAATLIIPVMDATGKYLTAYLPPLEISLGRFVFQGLFAVLAAALGPGFKSLKVGHLAPELTRGVFLAISSAFFLTATKYMPVADATAIFFVEPMILTALSAIFLKEMVGLRRWSAIAVGLLGAVIIIRPGFAAFGSAAFLPLGTALTFAVYLMYTRKLAGDGTMLGIQMMTGIGGALTTLVLLAGSVVTASPDAPVLVMPTPFTLALMAVVGGVSFLGHGLMVKAFACAPASLLAPFNYLEIVSSTTLGFVMFGDFPDLPTWLGIAIIVASGLYIAHREHVRSAKLHATATATRGQAAQP